VREFGGALASSTEPSTFETCAERDQLVRGVSIARPRRDRCGRRRSAGDVDLAPTRSRSICHGTMLE
jgi:hypothetical protein